MTEQRPPCAACGEPLNCIPERELNGPAVHPDCARREQQADAERQANLRLRADLVEAVRELRAELERVRGERDTLRDEAERAASITRDLMLEVQCRVGPALGEDLVGAVRRLLSRMESDKRLGDQARTRAEGIAKERSEAADRLTAERDAARTALARLRTKVGPVVEWWRAYTPVLVDLRGIVPVLARRLDVLKAGWED